MDKQQVQYLHAQAICMHVIYKRMMHDVIVTPNPWGLYGIYCLSPRAEKDRQTDIHTHSHFWHLISFSQHFLAMSLVDFAKKSPFKRNRRSSCHELPFADHIVVWLSPHQHDHTHYTRIPAKLIVRACVEHCEVHVHMLFYYHDWMINLNGGARARIDRQMDRQTDYCLPLLLMCHGTLKCRTLCACGIIIHVIHVYSILWFAAHLEHCLYK